MRAFFFAAVAVLSIAGSACAQGCCGGGPPCPDLRAFGTGYCNRPLFMNPINYGCYSQYTAHRDYVNGVVPLPPCPPPVFIVVPCAPTN